MKNRDNLCLTVCASALLICVLIIGLSAAQTSGEQNASSNDSSSEDEFPYPRGTAPPYDDGMGDWHSVFRR